MSGRTIRTTAEHPFYVWNQGWTAAYLLKTGDRLRSDDGQTVTVEAVCDSGTIETVYNCRVAEYHTYFVGSAAWQWSVWAHNACNVTANKAQGDKAEAIILARLKNNKNLKVLGEQVRIRTPGVPHYRKTDFLVLNQRTNKMFIVEVKSGGGYVKPSQAAKDALIANGGTAGKPTVFFGKQAAKLANTNTGPIPTFVAHVP